MAATPPLSLPTLALGAVIGVGFMAAYNMGRAGCPEAAGSGVYDGVVRSPETDMTAAKEQQQADEAMFEAGPDEGMPAGATPMRKGGGGTGPINLVETIRRERRHAFPGHKGVFFNVPREPPLVSTRAISATRTNRSAIDTNVDNSFVRLAKQSRRPRHMPVVAGSSV